MRDIRDRLKSVTVVHSITSDRVRKYKAGRGEYETEDGWSSTSRAAVPIRLDRARRFTITVFVVSSVLIGGGGAVAATMNAGGIAVSLGEPANVTLTERAAGSRVSSGTANLTEADTKISGDTATERAGWEITNAGDVNGDGVSDVVIGAPGSDDGATNAGAVYVFYGPIEEDISLAQADAVFTGETAGDRAGVSIAAGDLDGDGYSDVVVGAPRNGDAGRDAGAVYVIRGGPSLGGVTSLADADAAVYGGSEGDRAGRAVGIAALDRTVAIVVGAPGYDGSGEATGAAYVVPDGELTSSASLDGMGSRWVGASAGDRAGQSIATAGDIADDGPAKILVGAPNHSATESEAGAAYVISDPVASTRSRLADAAGKVVGDQAGARVGFAVGDAGDVNGDGLSDLLIGAPYTDSSVPNAGAAYVISRSRATNGTVRVSNADVTLRGVDRNDHAGWSVAATGTDENDCDGSIVVGAPFADTGDRNAGSIYFVAAGESRTTVPLETARATVVGEDPGDLAGYDVSAAGDIDGDDTGDVFVGAPFHGTDESNAGATYAIQGRCRTGGVQPATPEAGATTTTTSTQPTETTTATTTTTTTRPQVTTTPTPTTETSTDSEPTERQSLRLTTECEFASLTNPNDVPIVVTVTTESGESAQRTIGPGQTRSVQAPPGTYTITAAHDGRAVPINGETSLTVTIETC
ncbi:hypothetical protein BRC82_10115 [Halobacteriales archaeon QS_1_67_19]|nr:MAG: hypothetical protein BRC82_10115 [Halobacteriales archaeon QS_1_67_19]